MAMDEVVDPPFRIMDEFDIYMDETVMPTLDSVSLSLSLSPPRSHAVGPADAEDRHGRHPSDEEARAAVHIHISAGHALSGAGVAPCRCAALRAGAGDAVQGRSLGVAAAVGDYRFHWLPKVVRGGDGGGGDGDGGGGGGDSY